MADKVKRWEVKEYEVVNERVFKVIVSGAKFPIFEQVICECADKKTAREIVALHNATLGINPSNPMAVAEGLEDTIEQLKEADEVICNLCKRLNPQHATADYGKGCEWCEERGHRLNALAAITKPATGDKEEVK